MIIDCLPSLERKKFMESTIIRNDTPEFSDLRRNSTLEFCVFCIEIEYNARIPLNRKTVLLVQKINICYQEKYKVQNEEYKVQNEVKCSVVSCSANMKVRQCSQGNNSAKLDNNQRLYKSRLSNINPWYIWFTN